MNEQPAKPQTEWDPTYLHSLRETYVIMGLFALFCVWSLFVCYQYGYLGPDEQLTTVPTVLGMPSWAFWGICLPWLAVDVVAVWFCFYFMAPDDLGEAHEGEDLAEQIAHEADRKETHHE